MYVFLHTVLEQNQTSGKKNWQTSTSPNVSDFPTANTTLIAVMKVDNGAPPYATCC